MANFCGKCGASLPPETRFCPSCGLSVNEDTRAQSAYAPPDVTTRQYVPGQPTGNGLKEKLFSTEGRLNRKPFILRKLLLGVAANVLGGFLGGFFGGFFASASANATVFSAAQMMAQCLFSLAMLYPFYCLDVRRLHDLGRNETLANVMVVLGAMGALALGYTATGGNGAFFILLFPLASLPIGLYLLFAKGMHGTNQYGPDPLEQRN